MSDVLTSAKWLGQIYATMACGLVVLDPDGVVLDANVAAQEILGASGPTLRGQTLVLAFQ